MWLCSWRVGDKSNNVWVGGDHMTKIDRSYKSLFFVYLAGKHLEVDERY